MEDHRQAHVQDVETKKRLTRMLGDYKQLKATIASRRGEEYTKKKEPAQKKMEEKAKWRAAVLKAREEERQAREEEERIRREKEEEERRLEAGTWPWCL